MLWIISTWPHIIVGTFLHKSLLAYTKTWHSWSCWLIELSHLWNLEICSWTRCSFVDVFILIVIWFIINHSWRRSFLWKHSARDLAADSTCIVFNYFFDFLACIELADCAFSLIHSSLSFACKACWWLIVIKRLHCFDIVWARANSVRWLWIIKPFFLCLRPYRSPLCFFFSGKIVMTGSNPILLLSFVNLDGRLIKLKFVILIKSQNTFIFIIAVSVDVRGDWRNRLIFVDVDKMFDNLWFWRGCPSTEHFGALATNARHVILARTWHYIFFFHFREPLSSRFEDWIGSWYLQNFDVFSFRWNNNLLPVLIVSNVIGSGTWQVGILIAVIFRPRFHTAKWYKGLRYFILALNLCLIGAWSNRMQVLS